MQSLTGMETALHECLQRGIVLADTSGVDEQCQVGFGVRMKRSELHDRWSKEFGKVYGWPSSHTKFWVEMAKAGKGMWKDAGRKQQRNVRVRYVEFADLETCRGIWDATQFNEVWG